MKLVWGEVLVDLCAGKSVNEIAKKNRCNNTAVYRLIRKKTGYSSSGFAQAIKNGLIKMPAPNGKAVESEKPKAPEAASRACRLRKIQLCYHSCYLWRVCSVYKGVKRNGKR